MRSQGWQKHYLLASVLGVEWNGGAGSRDEGTPSALTTIQGHRGLPELNTHSPQCVHISSVTP